jgi:hypothetical protein
MRKRDKIRQLFLGLTMASMMYTAMLITSFRRRYNEYHTSQ